VTCRAQPHVRRNIPSSDLEDSGAPATCNMGMCCYQRTSPVIMVVLNGNRFYHTRTQELSDPF